MSCHCMDCCELRRHFETEREVNDAAFHAWANSRVVVTPDRCGFCERYFLRRGRG